MFPFAHADTARAVAAFAALDRAQATIQFDMDGTILTANENFLKLFGYTLGEIKGAKHAIFVDAAEREGAAYRQFWDGFARGSISPVRIQAHRQGRQGSLDPRHLRAAARQGGPRFRRDQVRGGHHRACPAQRRHRRAVVRAAQDSGGDRVRTRRPHRHRQREFLAHDGLYARGNPGTPPRDLHRSRRAEFPGIPHVLGAVAQGRVSGRTVQAPWQGRARGLDPGRLQPHPRHERQALQGREVRHRRHRAGRADEAQPDPQGRSRRTWRKSRRPSPAPRTRPSKPPPPLRRPRATCSPSPPAPRSFRPRSRTSPARWPRPTRSP